MAEKYLGFQQPGSVYGFSDAGAGHRRVSSFFSVSNFFSFLLGLRDNLQSLIKLIFV